MSRMIVGMRFAPYSETPLDAVRCSAQIIEVDGTVSESFGPSCWVDGGRNAEISIGHDTPALGRVLAIGAANGWYEADVLVETDDPEQLKLIRPGQQVSLGAISLEKDPDHGIGVRRHRRCLLEHIAIARPGEVGAIKGAKITRVVESKLASRQRPTLSRVLTAEQAHAEVWRRVREGEDFGDAYLDMADRNITPSGNWYLPVPKDCCDVA